LCHIYAGQYITVKYSSRRKISIPLDVLLQMLHQTLCRTSTAQHYIGAESGSRRLAINVYPSEDTNNNNVFIKDMFLTSYYPRICWFPSASYHFSSRASAVSSLHNEDKHHSHEALIEDTVLTRLNQCKLCAVVLRQVSTLVTLWLPHWIWERYCIHPCS